MEKIISQIFPSCDISEHGVIFEAGPNILLFLGFFTFFIEFYKEVDEIIEEFIFFFLRFR